MTQNQPCNGVNNESKKQCLAVDDIGDSNNNDNGDDDKANETFVGQFIPNNLSVNAQGLRLAGGLKLTLLAKAGTKFALNSPQASTALSPIPFHSNPDGAAVFELADGGWAYISNAENTNAKGGVFSLEFDPNGRPRRYRKLLGGTTRNCSGGKTPWNTWVSCEEYGRGQCWQVDPTGKRGPAKTKLVEPAGGNFESMAYEMRNPRCPRFYVTEDHERGALRRFTPPCGRTLQWSLLHGAGTLDYLEFLPGRRFRWTKSLSDGRTSAFRNYQFVEGISYSDDILSFVAKKTKKLFRLDLAKMTYSIENTSRGNLNGGAFVDGPDQIVQLNDMMYFTEDGGRTPGVYMTNGSRYYSILEASARIYRGDETTGLAFSPDGRRMYVCMQEIGYLFQIERVDGEPFQGRGAANLKFHQTEPK